MDHGSYINNELLSESSKVKLEIEECIERTNAVVNRWINVNKLSLDKIYREDVNSLFLGYLTKVFRSHSCIIDFRKFSKLVYITIDSDKSIINIVCDNVNNSYFRFGGFIKNIVTAIESIDYLKLRSSRIENLQVIEEAKILNLEHINNIKF